ncbi:MAG: UDP-glucose 4-epimerase GalE [Deltaproteobacteria bacterium]|nr:UDP-glucose 4-epimerase GalE [Deltaproteobacteria bacterium]
MKVLVTGGAGYIGSHAVKALGEKGYQPVTLDNLSTGHEWAVLYGDLIKGDLADRDLIQRVLSEIQPDAVMHFAAFILPEESVRLPLQYYNNNVVNTLNLLDGMKEAGVDKFIFSSSATVYSPSAKVPLLETAPLKPINPYGWTKVMVEQILHDLSKAGDMKHVTLRYFNVAGADVKTRIGQAYRNATHLITRALKTAAGERELLQVYGTDYSTEDGTCVRDYIHIDDLAEAHILALDYLMAGGQSDTFNCGYGHGFSNREVIDAIKSVTGNDFPTEDTDRRPGDLPATIADSTKIKNILNWSPKYDNLEFIIKTAWDWEKNLNKNEAG